MHEKSLHQKQEILNWLLSLEDEVMISKIDEFRKEMLSHHIVSESQTEFNVKDDFDERFAKGIPHEEMKKRTAEYINSLP
ncbi:MAG: hypothetical protein L6264_10460 [Weeksellaceae bacterium]|nr:hypothetical protein [Bacteroidota bacterium]MCG2781363.1 hypothetical protein [Weeksellaceae bacterium]